MAGIGAPGCSWNVGLETGVYMPIVANAAKDAKSPVLNVPATPGGWTFFDQALFLDAQANAAGLVTSWSSEWYVSLGSMVTGATAYALRDPSGYKDAEKVITNRVPVLRFSY
jgi:hypothetical protein